MKAQIKEGIDLLEEEQYEQAYNIFNEILEIDKKNIDAMYYRSIIDYIHLRKDLMKTYNNLKYLVDKKTKYRVMVLPLLTFLCDELSLNSDIIKYARMTIDIPNEYDMEIKNILIKALRDSEQLINLIEALAIVESTIASDQDCPFEIYIMQIDLMQKLKMNDKCNEKIADIFTKFTPNAVMYYIKAKVLINNYFEKKDKTQLKEAINNYEIALQYDEDMASARLGLAECYAFDNDINKAIEVVNGFETKLANLTNIDDINNLKSDILVEKIKLCETAKKWEVGIDLCEKFLENNYSWKIDYSLGYLINVAATTIEDLQKAKEHILNAYQQKNELFFVFDLYYLNIKLKKYQENSEILLKVLNDYPDNGYLYFLYADNLQHYSNNYFEILHYYNMAYDYGYLDDEKYLSIVPNIVEKPKKLYKRIKKIITKGDSKNAWMLRKKGIRYLYGEDGIKTDLVKAENFLEAANNQETEEPCLMCLYARCLEIKNKKEEALKIYQEALKIYRKEIHMTCNCCFGYLANSYITNFPSPENIEKAKELIIEAIEIDGEDSSACVILLYGYFSLLKDERFDRNKALKYLNSVYSFYRYDISKVVISNAISKMDGLGPVYNDKEINNILKNLPKDHKQYYVENKDKEIVYPYYKNI